MRKAIPAVILLSLFAELFAVNPGMLDILLRNMRKQHSQSPYTTYKADSGGFSILNAQSPFSTPRWADPRRRRWNTMPSVPSASEGFSENSGNPEDVTEAYVHAGNGARAPSTNGLFRRKIIQASGAHIVRDSWCRVNASNNCIPAL